MIAFVFHSVQPSGANLWLARFVTEGPFDPKACVCILPGESPLATTLTAAGATVRVLPLGEVTLAGGGSGGAVRAVADKARYFLRLVGLLRSLAPELVYINSGIQVMPGPAARLAGCRVLWHIREAWGAGRAFRVKRAVTVSTAHALLFDARAGRSLYAPFRVNQPALVVPNGVPTHLAQLRADRAAIRAELGWHDNDTVLLFLGSVVQRKGLHDLLAIWPELRAARPGLRLVVAGGTDPNETHPALRDFPISRPAGIDYLGFRSDAPRLLAGADAFVLPSYGEAMPISISEAMMVGCPVIARDVGDVAWQLGEDRGWMFSGDGAEPLRRSIEACLADPAAARARAQAAHTFALENLTWSAQCATIRQVAEQAAERPLPTR